MRTIKFRAWDKENKIMIYPEQKENETSYVTINAWCDSENDKVILMEFTGLTDKNGKEIYEGDVLRFPPKDKWEEKNYSCFEVFFHDGDSNTDYSIGYSINRMHNHGAVCGGYIPSFKPKTVIKMEVIGNIHDNPELCD